MVGFMTKIEVHTQSHGGVIATVRIGTRVLRVCGEKPFRGCFVCEQLEWFITHVIRSSDGDASGASLLACDASPRSRDASGDDASRLEHDASSS